MKIKKFPLREMSCKKCDNGKVKNLYEPYVYPRNQPKNSPILTLEPKRENYTYDYPYANYKPRKHEQKPDPKVESAWPGVI